MVTMRSSVRSAAITYTRDVPDTVRTAVSGRGHRAAQSFCSILAVANKSRPQKPGVIHNERFDDERSRVRLESGRYVTHVPFEGLAGRGIDLERHRTADGDLG